MTEQLMKLSTEIVCSFASNKKLEPSELPALIQSVFQSLASLGQAPVEVKADGKPTAAQIRKSIRPDALISFLDGLPYKMLKRHLTSNGLTFNEYKAKFGLPFDYPSVAPNYSAERSATAKSYGLGKSSRGAAVKTQPTPSIAARSPGRPKKVPV